jgi:hypothetical protein
LGQGSAPSRLSFDLGQAARIGAGASCRHGRLPPHPDPGRGALVLTLEDCLALCDLTEDEVLAIAQHEHIPEIAAVEMGNYLLHCPDGELYIRAMIRDDITAAAARGDERHALALKWVLRNFVLQHPKCEQRHRDALHVPERRTPGYGGQP